MVGATSFLSSCKDENNDKLSPSAIPMFKKENWHVTNEIRPQFDWWDKAYLRFFDIEWNSLANKKPWKKMLIRIYSAIYLNNLS